MRKLLAIVLLAPMMLAGCTGKTFVHHQPDFAIGGPTSNVRWHDDICFTCD